MEWRYWLSSEMCLFCAGVRKVQPSRWCAAAHDAVGFLYKSLDAIQVECMGLDGRFVVPPQGFVESGREVHDVLMQVAARGSSGPRQRSRIRLASVELTSALLPKRSRHSKVSRRGMAPTHSFSSADRSFVARHADAECLSRLRHSRSSSPAPSPPMSVKH